MARLSWLFGELALLKDAVPAKTRAFYKTLATRLDHPRRTEEFIERDERWLWARGEESK